jgi:hypothetical protein
MLSYMNNSNTKQVAGLKYQPIRFINLSLAIEHAANCIKPQRVMLGDDSRFWIVCPADAARLEAMGYEYAN